MEFNKLVKRAVEIREKYSVLEKEKYGKSWGLTERAQGFVGDVGDLTKLIMAKSGARDIQNVDEKLKHELSDCLWSILTLADELDIDIESEFLKNMDKLEIKIKNENLS